MPSTHSVGARSGAPFRVLVVDDDIPVCRLLRDFLEKLAVDVDTAVSGEQALEKFSPGSHDLLLLDLMLPGQSGLQTLRDVRRRDVDVRILVMTGYGTIERAVDAMKSGATEFLLKPLSLQELKDIVVRERNQVEIRSRGLPDVDSWISPLGFRIITCDVAMLRLLKMVDKIASLPSTVLIEGESGTGKELLARAIHTESDRSKENFVAINCGAVPEQLLESELFGYERGAFTGAVGRKIGLFEAADKGTIFLDEIGEMSTGLQVKLLRVLQERTFRRLGDTKEVATGARVIASTNRNLEKEVSLGRFREDLYYRINVIKLEVPPLRDRPDDIPLLSRYFLAKYSQQFHRQFDGISDAAMELLRAHPWTGNVRELQNVVEHAVAVAEHDCINDDDLPEYVRSDDRPGHKGFALEPLGRAKERFEKEYLRRVLERAKGNVSLAARQMSIPRQNLYDKLKKYDLSVENYRPE